MKPDHLLIQESSYLLSFLLLLIVTFSYFKRYGLVCSILLLIGFLFYFYRRPERVNNYPANIIVSPSDGTIQKIEIGQKSVRISIFLSLADAHVQWIPTSGQISNIEYKPGQFNPAFLFNKSNRNEKNIISILHPKGFVTVEQIAGVITRRIVSWTKIGQSVFRGQIYGMIKLSSRVDIILPKNIILYVKVGQKVKGNITALASWK